MRRMFCFGLLFVPGSLPDRSAACFHPMTLDRTNKDYIWGDYEENIAN